MKIRYIKEKEISQKADDLLNTFKKQYPQPQNNIEINIEAIASFLGLKVYFQDLKSSFSSNVLGMIIPSEKTIFIDKSIEPIGKNKDINEKVLRFTLAHEIGHYILHKDYDPAFFYGLNKQEKIRVEIQANKFASNILMPKDNFTTEYHKHYSSDLDCIINNLSNAFNVSKQSVKYRIKEVKL